MSFLKGKLNIVFWLSAITISSFVCIGAIFPDAFAKGAKLAYDFTTSNFGWFYLLSVSFMVLFLIYLALSKYGHVRLGGEKEKPEFTRKTWISMLISCGLGIAIIFYSVGEPMSHFYNPPYDRIESQSVEAAKVAMGYTFFHYGISIWAIFGVVGLVMAYFLFSKKKDGLVSTSIEPLMKNKNNRFLKNTINILAVVATVMGIATSLGLGILQTNGGLNALFDTPISPWVQMAIIAVLTVLFLISSTSGLQKGIKWLSNINMGMALVLMLFVFFAGPTVFILETFTVAIGDYITNFIHYSFRMTPYNGSTWVQEWTIFYWAWVIAWSPFVGAFFARISRGRTIREYIFGVMVVPALLSLFWFAVFGGTALYMDLFQGTNIAESTNQDITLAIFALFETLPLSNILSVFTIILILTFLITSADSASFILGSMSSGGSLNPPKRIRIVWGILTSSVAVVLLFASGLTGLQTASLVVALPFTVVILFMIYSFYKVIRHEPIPKPKRKESRKSA